MSKKSEYKQIIIPLLKNEQFDTLRAYIVAHTNLPGKMANITLVHEIARAIHSIEATENIYAELQSFWQVAADGNDANTVVALAALESFGAIYTYVDDKRKKEIELLLHTALDDKRWRMREIVTESYKWIAMQNYKNLMLLFDAVLAENVTPSEIRGILATVAHPSILKTDEEKAYAQKIMEIAFSYYITLDQNVITKQDKEILKKGLSFAPSVIVSKNPVQGFLFFESLINLENKELHSIIKENLMKKRLVSFYPEEVEKLLNLL